jgi:flagellar basal body P-ring formation protein FlgA
MIIPKNKLKIIFTLFVCFYLSSPLGNWASAEEPQILTADEIEKGAVDYLEKTLPWEKDSLEINVYYKGKEITLPPGEKKLIYKTMGSHQKAGRIPMYLEIRVNSNFQKKIRLNSRVLVSQEIIKTTRSVRKGDILSNDDIHVETVKTERPWKNAIRKIDLALGYEATRTLSIGKILIPNYIKKPALGNRGDKILILAEKGGMKITAPGILKEDGYEDAMVRVLNMESKKIIYGRLVDSNTVKVSF